VNYLVVLEAAWPVRDVRSAQDAASVAIAEAGKRLNPRHHYVDVAPGSLVCSSCGAEHDAVLVVAGWALVGLSLELIVFNAQSPEHAGRIAKKELGEALGDVPLRVHSAEPVADEGERGGPAARAARRAPRGRPPPRRRREEPHGG